jgi:hypothetical protein
MGGKILLRRGIAIHADADNQHEQLSGLFCGFGSYF